MDGNMELEKEKKDRKYLGQVHKMSDEIGLVAEIFHWGGDSEGRAKRQDRDEFKKRLEGGKDSKLVRLIGWLLG